MMVTTTDGYIVNVLGPYFADGKNNDAAITKPMFETNADSISQWMLQDDILILDRGFEMCYPALGILAFRSTPRRF